MDDLLTVIMSLGPWAWIVAGVVLLAIELLVPGGIFVWLGASAVLVGVLNFVVPLSLPVAWVLYGVFAVASIYIWLKLSARNRGEQSDRPFLNKRVERFVGREAVLNDAIAGGFGRVRLDDTVWRVAGPDLPVGTRVRITGHDGTLLMVEPIG